MARPWQGPVGFNLIQVRMDAGFAWKSTQSSRNIGSDREVRGFAGPGLE